MKKLTDFNNADLTPEELNQGMKDLLNDKFNKELREKYSRKLKNEYNIQRQETEQISDETKSSTIEREETKKINWLFPLLLIGVLIVGTYFMTKSTQRASSQPANTEQLIQQYFASNHIEYIDNNRSSTSNDKTRSSAISSFQEKDFINAAGQFEQIKNKTIQDQFFQAYSLLKSKDYKKAAAGFANFISNNRDQENYLAEAKLYQILSILELEQNEIAKMLYNKLESNSWEKKELKSIFDSMEEN